MNIVDLHIHTEFSDGKMKISDLEHFAKENGIKYLAIVDHDTIEGYNHFINGVHNEEDFHMISGIEVTTQYEGKTLHLLGYDMDVNNKDFMILINKIKISFIAQYMNVVRYLQKEGYDLKIKKEWLEKGLDSLASFCVEKCYFADKSAFYKHVFYCGDEHINKRRKPDACEVIESISKAGGFVSLAHPTRVSKDINEIEHIIKGLRAYKLEAIECFHPLQKENAKVFIELANKFNLYITGGSDFHESGSDIYSSCKSLIPYDDKSYKWSSENYYIYL